MFLLVFGFGALWAYLKYRNTGSKKVLLLAGILGGLAMSIKWTGVAFIGLVGLFEIIYLLKERSLKTLGYMIIYLVVVPFLIYFSVFAIHFSILTKSGQGDAFMSPEFQKTLSNSRYSEDNNINSLSISGKFFELNREMYKSNQRLTSEHPYSSQWYSWPYMARTIYYWNGDGARIYLIGNPIIWWTSSIAILAFLLMILIRSLPINIVTGLIAVGYMVNVLPFIGVKRVMFLYHYLPALIFAIIALLYLIEKQKKSGLILKILLISAIALFFYFAPLNYGLDITDADYENRMWLESWK